MPIIKKLNRDPEFRSKRKQLARKTKIKNDRLDKRTDEDALKKSKLIVRKKVQQLRLIHAGFGRYHKRRGDPITHWVMRNPANGLYVIVTKKERYKLLKKPLLTVKTASAPRKTTKDTVKTTIPIRTAPSKPSKSTRNDSVPRKTTIVPRSRAVTDPLKLSLTRQLKRFLRTVKKKVA